MSHQATSVMRVSKLHTGKKESRNDRAAQNPSAFVTLSAPDRAQATEGQVFIRQQRMQTPREEMFFPKKSVIEEAELSEGLSALSRQWERMA